MNFSEIKELLNAGFTPDQIIMLTTSVATPTQATDSAPGDIPPVIPLQAESPGVTDKIPEPDPEEVKVPDPIPGKTPEPDPGPGNKEVIDAINDLKKSIQAGNILRNSVDIVDPENALEKAMAEFIRPSFENMNKKEG